MNVLLKTFSTPFKSIPFEEINKEDFKPAFLQAIEEAKQEIDSIIKNPEPPMFVNVIMALEKTGKKLQIIASTFFNLNSAETNDYLQNVAQEISPILTEYSNDILLNEELFSKIKIAIDNTLKSKLPQEEITLLDNTYKNFVRNGILLAPEDKEKLRAIDIELSSLSLEFGQNVLKETNNYFLKITKKKDLEGLPESLINMAKEDANSRKIKGYVFTLHAPSYIPFLKYSKKRELREELYKAASSRGFHDNEYSNEEILKKIITLRNDRANLLGYNSHADFVLQERMASSPTNVITFLNDLLNKAKPFSVKEIEELKKLAEKDGITEIMPYDHAYYSEKLRQLKFDLSEEELKPYFPLNQVLDSAFKIAEELYGLKFKERKDIQKYHEDVVVYEVLEKNKHKALLYTDFFPREGKRAGAWMTSYKGQYKTIQENIRPHISIVCNFSKPLEDTPSLLTFDEVTTLFHEFGHALHGILADTQFENLSGTNVYWDFVELPSQFMENFCYEKEFLSTFAKHYKTGEALSEDKINKITSSHNFMQGYQTVRQIGLGLLDMAYHTNKFNLKEDTVKSFELEQTKETKLYPDIKETVISTAFSHIFQGGYSSGYYSYKWAEVLDADAFSFFKETGLFNKDTALRFKTMLSKGGTENPMELYIKFRGRTANPEALLKRAGLIDK